LRSETKIPGRKKKKMKMKMKRGRVATGL